MRLRPGKKIQKRIGAEAPVRSPSLPGDGWIIRISARNDFSRAVLEGVGIGVVDPGEAVTISRTAEVSTRNEVQTEQRSSRRGFPSIKIAVYASSVECER